MEADPSSDDAARKENAWKWSLLLLLLLLLTGWWFFSSDDGSKEMPGTEGRQKTRAAGTGPETSAKSGSRFDRPRSSPRRADGAGAAASQTSLAGSARTSDSAGSGAERPMVALQEMAVVKSEQLVEAFGREQLTNQILEEAVNTVSEKHGVRFVFSSDAVSTGNVRIFPITRSLKDFTGEVRTLLVNQYGLKPAKKSTPKPEERRALTKTGK